ncbi:uncharacterized protein LOC122250225 [Penaeus japonicus]|uniref:uncharacterized protein LOC122250225 n=1 Tax=Penaeus japonicus TaxID=27405 RepID=UPI001C710E86|nr:uncharacterized protein LOC122250225 [Penaeus japonicus]
MRPAATSIIHRWTEGNAVSAGVPVSSPAAVLLMCCLRVPLPQLHVTEMEGQTEWRCVLSKLHFVVRLSLSIEGNVLGLFRSLLRLTATEVYAQVRVYIYVGKAQVGIHILPHPHGNITPPSSLSPKIESETMASVRSLVVLVLVALSLAAVCESLVLCPQFPSCCSTNSCKPLCPSCREAQFFTNGVRNRPSGRVPRISFINGDPFANPSSGVFPDPLIFV